MSRLQTFRLLFSRYCLLQSMNVRNVSDSGDFTAAFASAQEKLKSVETEPNDKIKLELYALYKQATIGVCNTPKPGAFDFVANAKRDAWLSLGDMTKDDAQKGYAKLVDRITGKSGSGAS